MPNAEETGLCRDIRLTAGQLYYGKRAVSDRVRELERRLARSSYAGKSGMRESVLRELEALRELERVLEHNRRQLGRQFSALVRGARAELEEEEEER